MLEWKKQPIAAFAQRPILLLLAALVAGCAGASVAPQSQSAPVTGGRPSTIYVYPFAATAQDVTLNQGFFQRAYQNLTNANVDQDQVQIAEATAQALAANIVQELQGKGYNAVQLARGTAVTGDNVLIVDGEFVDINEGNRLRRMVMGWENGQATLNTKVQICRMANGNADADPGFHNSRRQRQYARSRADRSRGSRRWWRSRGRLAGRQPRRRCGEDLGLSSDGIPREADRRPVGLLYVAILRAAGLALIGKAAAPARAEHQGDAVTGQG